MQIELKDNGTPILLKIKNIELSESNIQHIVNGDITVDVDSFAIFEADDDTNCEIKYYYTKGDGWDETGLSFSFESTQIIEDYGLDCDNEETVAQMFFDRVQNQITNNWGLNENYNLQEAYIQFVDFAERKIKMLWKRWDDQSDRYNLDSFDGIMNMKCKLMEYKKKYADCDQLGVELAKLCHVNDGFGELFRDSVEGSYDYSSEVIANELDFIYNTEPSDIEKEYFSGTVYMHEDYDPLINFKNPYSLIEDMMRILGGCCAEYIEARNIHELGLDKFHSALVEHLYDNVGYYKRQLKECESEKE